MLTCNNGPTVSPDVFSSTVSWFGGGANYPAGTYSVGYMTGSMELQASDGWSAIFYHIVNDAGHDVLIPNNGLRYGTQAQCAAANAGYCANFNHSGGRIGVFFSDGISAQNPAGSYGDNVAGAPNPTYMLCPGFGTCSAGDPVPPGVPVPTLTATPSLPGNVSTILLQAA